MADNKALFEYIDKHGKKQNKRTNWVMVIVLALILIGNMPNFIPKYNGSQNATKKDIEMVQKEIEHVKELITKDIKNMKDNDIKHEKRFNFLETRMNNHIQSSIH